MEKIRNFDKNGYLMTKHQIERTISKWNRNVMPLLAAFGLCSTEDVQAAWSLLNGGESIRRLIDLKAERSPVDDMPQSQFEQIYEERLLRYIEQLFPAWRRTVPADETGEVMLENPLPLLFPLLRTDYECYLTIDSLGLSLKEPELKEAFTTSPTDEQMKIFEMAEAVCNYCFREKTDIHKLFKPLEVFSGYARYEVNPATFSRMTPYYSDI